MGEFWQHTDRNPWIDRQQIWQIWLGVRAYPTCQIWRQSIQWVLQGILVKYNVVLLYFSIFSRARIENKHFDGFWRIMAQKTPNRQLCPTQPFQDRNIYFSNLTSISVRPRSSKITNWRLLVVAYLCQCRYARVTTRESSWLSGSSDGAFYVNLPAYTTCSWTNWTQPSQTDYDVQKHLRHFPLELKNFESHSYPTV